MKKVNNRKLGRRNFIKTMAAAGVGITLIGPRKGLAQALGEPSSVASFTAREHGKLKILGLTDLHFFNAKEAEDEHTLQDIRAMIKIVQPEMIVIDGDIWFEDDFGKGIDRCKWSCKKLGELGIPWAFVWGNHDTSIDHRLCHPIITSAANSLYRGTRYDGHYRIEIKNPGEDKPFWDFIIVNDGLPESGFQNEQIQWFKAEADRIKQKYSNPPPAFLFCHVPLTQFHEIVLKGIARGVKGEMTWSEKGGPEAFWAIKKSGMVKAVFCGHDHVNNFGGELNGVWLQYLRSSGYGGYGNAKVKKGGTIITIDTTKPGRQFETITVFADGSTWELKDPVKRIG
jgi:hypothetical protein